MELIKEADVFQLFWSKNSMVSPWVRREWEYALSLDRPNFVRPTYWETPRPEAPEQGLPPEALKRLQFWLLPIRGERDAASHPSSGESVKESGAAHPERSTKAPVLNEDTQAWRRSPTPPKIPAADPGQTAARDSSVTPEDVDEHTTVLGDLRPRSVPAARLRRLRPAEHAETVALDRVSYLVGRLPSCDVRLYSGSASREHAQIFARDERWYIAPVSGKVVLVNGASVGEACALTHDARLQFGDDEFVFFSDEAAVEKPRTNLEPLTGALVSARLPLVVGILVIVAALVWIFFRR